MPKLILIYSHKLNPVEDYIDSLGVFDAIVELAALNLYDLQKPDHLFFFTQMWFLPLLHNPKFPFKDYASRIFFINVEMLTEHNRYTQIRQLLAAGVQLVDYSPTNISIMHHIIKSENIPYPHIIRYLPYQYNHTEKIHLQNEPSVNYDYDVGMINVYPVTDDNTDNTDKGRTRRSEIFERLCHEPNITCRNIVGWGRDRDREISRCRIIVNVHHFEQFRVFEDIRCARLIFANKLVVSEKNLNDDLVDIKDFIYWADFDNIVDVVKHIIANFQHYQADLVNKSKEVIKASRQNILHEFKKPLNVCSDEIMSNHV